MSLIRWRRRRKLFVLGLLAAVLLGARHLPTGWLVMTPGNVLPLAAQVTVSPTATLPKDDARGGTGDVMLLTVIAQRANVYRLALAASGLMGPAMITRQSQMIPSGMSPSEYVATGRTQMVESTGLGSYLALRAAGEPAECGGAGARVVAVYEAGVGERRALQVGDLVLAVEDAPIELSGDVALALRGRAPGDVVTLTVLREAYDLTLAVRLNNVVTGAEEAMLGALLLSEEPSFRLSREVSVDTAGISGPSGGLAIALAVYQAPGTEDILRGRIVAASGYVRRDGTVGPVGGSGLKAIAASETGADILLVAQANREEAAAAAPGLKVVAVESFEQALEVLGRGVSLNWSKSAGENSLTATVPRYMPR